MIVMTLEIEVTGSKREEILAALRQLAGPLDVQPGCLECRILQDIRTDQVITFVVVWATDNDLKRHVRSDQFWKVLTLMEASCGNPAIGFHTVIHTAGMESVEQIRGKGKAPDRVRDLERGIHAPFK